jgi:hypothetical protein
MRASESDLVKNIHRFKGPVSFVRSGEGNPKKRPAEDNTIGSVPIADPAKNRKRNEWRDASV